MLKEQEKEGDASLWRTACLVGTSVMEWCGVRVGGPCNSQKYAIRSGRKWGDHLNLFLFSQISCLCLLRKGWTLWRNTLDSTQNSIWVLRLVMPYIYQKSMKRLSSHNQDFSKSMVAPKQVQKQLERAQKRDWLGMFMEVRGWDQSEGLNFWPAPKERVPWFSN